MSGTTKHDHEPAEHEHEGEHDDHGVETEDAPAVPADPAKAPPPAEHPPAEMTDPPTPAPPPPANGNGGTAHVTVVQAGLRVGEHVVKALSPNLLAMLVLNGIFIAILFWFVDARARHTSEMINRLLEKCLPH